MHVVINHTELTLCDRYLLCGQDLVLADLHLGKTAHFRKAGLAIPSNAKNADQMALIKLLDKVQPQRMIVLGDLFHSADNSEVDELAMITTMFSGVDFVLVKGNHDILSESAYRSLNFTVVANQVLSGLYLSHEPVQAPEGLITMHGHVHPGVMLRGKGRQRLKLPCFYYYGNGFCLPAFGKLTGLMPIKPRKNDQVYGIVDGNVLALQ